MSNPTQLFPSIGSVADETQKVPEKEQVTASAQTADDEERPVQEIESLCMKCGEQGVTRLLLTTIPFFREVIVMSFRCEHCGFSNNEVQAASTIRPEGAAYTVRVRSRDDLNRQIVKSSTCTVTIPEFELTLPPGRGQLTTIEGLLRDVVADLSADQPLRRVDNEATYNKIQTIIDGLKGILADDEDEEDENGNAQPRKASEKNAPMCPFTIIVDDPTGNSFLEFVGSMADPKWNMRTYRRTRQQNIDLGLIAPDEAEKPAAEGAPQEGQANGEEEGPKVVGPEGQNEEIFVFPGTCSSCGHHINTLMKKVNIPYFKDIIIMSTNCEFCGYRDNEVKSGSAISPQGKRITLKVKDKEDLSRDILKSESCGMEIPEIDLVLQQGTLGGRFTTLEGILDQIYDELAEKVIAASDSHMDEGTFENFLKKLKEVKSAERPFTVILDDPLANSYMQNLYAPDPDPNMKIEMYDRTWEQNEELGLNDMKVENYQEDAQKVESKPEQAKETKKQ
ncbi:zf-ZPR1-domain-containing protein [Laetiporus sulphureus 93-53]|uniref:Zf-ZPR1-domain-containing protein n=1 Tax=Laetiporus sulphureus 93-53 TaxID=1314785 RepID=A0A165G9J8_9APHY|nr:zf-ZPR1-domain-containing protein [Laetiporus sulphureus 93-53]KZT10028.1 zf-ZPR1-domain-containing protein [Laetiporus sulphureus 93-53]